MNKTINVTRSSMPAFEEYCAEIRELWDSRWLTNQGVKHQALEAALRDYLGCEHLALHTNGHLALENLLEAFGLHQGEILTTPFTFASTTHAIVRSGCTPVFCDVEPETLTLDPRELERRLTKNTVAVLPVHVYGKLCDVDAIATPSASRGTGSAPPASGTRPCSPSTPPRSSTPSRAGSPSAGTRTPCSG